MNSISVSNKSWILKKFNENQLTYLKDNFFLDEITSKLLSIRNIKNEEVVGFLNVFFDNDNEKFPKDLKKFEILFNKKNLARKECILLPFKALTKALK